MKELVSLKNKFIRKFDEKGLTLTLVKKKHQIQEIRHPDFCHTFFGYYDRSPVSHDGTRLLVLCTNATNFQNRMEPGHLFVYLIREKKFQFVTKTSAWNFQQGCQQQWLDNERIIYNDIVSGKPVSIVLNVHTLSNKEKPVFEFQIGMVNTFTSTLCRMNYRPLDIHEVDYSYNFDNNSSDLIPNTWLDLSLYNYRSKNCVFHIGHKEHEILIRKLDSSLSEILYIQHIKFNPSGTKIFYVVRSVDNKNIRSSSLFSLDIESKVISVLIKKTDWQRGCNHPVWADNNNVLVNLFMPKWRARKFVLIDANSSKKRVIAKWSDGVGHPTAIKYRDRELILTDIYHGNTMAQRLVLYTKKQGFRTTMDILNPAPLPKGPDRCDLHPRFLQKLSAISIDCYSKGNRMIRIYYLP